MLAGTLAFVLGCICLLHLAALPPLKIVLVLPVLYIADRYYTWFKPILLFCLGFSWALIRVDYALIPASDKSFDQNEKIVSATVVSLPETYKDQYRFILDKAYVETVDNKKIKIKGKIRVSWYRPTQFPRPGERWQLKIKMKRPYSFMNPGGFDYEAWMLRQGIAYIAYVKNDANNQKIGMQSGYLIQTIRYNIANKLKQSLEQPLLGFAIALSLGDRSLLQIDTRQLLTKTGTNHLIAISGLHLSLICGIVYLCSIFVCRFFLFKMHYLSVPLFASLISFTAILFYAGLAGFSLPTQRALIMISLFLLSQLSGLRYKISDIISLAIFLILILDPLAVLAIDFWLSFTAVFLIIYLTRFRYVAISKYKQWIQIQLYLSFALLPFLVYWFNHIPVYSFLANLIAIPVIGFIILPVLLLAIILLFFLPSISEKLFDLIEVLNHIVWYILNIIANNNYSLVNISIPNLLILSLSIAGVLFLLTPKGVAIRFLGVIWLLPLLFQMQAKLEFDEFNFTLLDVGQGLAAVIQTKNEVLVYDTGAKFSDRFNAGANIIIPYLKSEGVNEISTLIVSHGDNDHIGGADALLIDYEIKNIFSSVPDKINNPVTEHCYAGQKWNWDGVDFEILHPGKLKLKGNNASCVLKVSSQNGSILLTGDIEKQAEFTLTNNNPSRLKADILIVPHHGSKTSSTPEFIKKVNPKYAFFPVGYRNRFGFPKQDIIQRYEDLGVDTRFSYQSGALLVKVRKGGLEIAEYRKQNQKIWHFATD